VARLFGELGDKSPSALPASPVAGPRGGSASSSDDEQGSADIAYGFTTLTRWIPGYYACWLMNHVRQLLMSGRLGDCIASGKAWRTTSTARSMRTCYRARLDSCGVSAANIDRAVASIDEEITRLVTDGLTQKELDDSRRFLIHAMPRALETNAGIANYLQTPSFFSPRPRFRRAPSVCSVPSRSTRPMRLRGSSWPSIARRSSLLVRIRHLPRHNRLTRRQAIDRRQQVQVDVKDRLPGASVRVEDRR